MPGNDIFSNEILWVLILTIYAVLITFLTKKTYEFMRKKGVKKNVAVYYNRKIIHIFAGGIIALIVPFVFSSPFFPLFSGLILTIFTYLPHKTGNILYWFQTKQNLYDVNFCLMWAVSYFLLWWIMGNPWVAAIPPVFMAFGDGITGIVRNAVFKRRIKHPIGNLFMVAVCLPLGYYLGGFGGIALGGVIAALVASFIERYEFGIIDDNVLITISSALILYFYPMVEAIVL